MIMNFLAMVTAIALDALIGDPQWMPHLVVLLGKLISYFDRELNRPSDSGDMKKLMGLATVLGMIFIAIMIGLPLDMYLPKPLAFIFKVIVFWYCIALKTLKDEAVQTVRRTKMSVAAGRKQLSRIVGRDTENLDEEHIMAAVIETVAENASDGVIAPILYGLIFGPAGAVVYKAINTMDSMIGYRNEKYRDFGFFAAKTDDIVNLIPARITALMAIGLAGFVGGDLKHAFSVYSDDNSMHDSPNSGHCESAFAGVLDVKLGGASTYGGQLEERPVINRKGSSPSEEDVMRAVTLLNYVTAGVMVLWSIIVAGELAI